VHTQHSDPRRTIPDDLEIDSQPTSMRVKRTRIVVNLTTSIRADLRKLTSAHQRTLALTCSIGDKLIRLKTEIGHGGWLDWLRDEFGLSVATADVYMDLARNSERVLNMPVDTTLRGARAILQAERKARKTALSSGRSFSAEQAARQSRQQRLKNTRVVYEKMAELAGSELVDVTFTPDELWPDRVECAQRLDALAQVVNIASLAALDARLGQAEEGSGPPQSLVESLRQQIASAPREVLEAVWDDTEAGGALGQAEWHYRRPQVEQSERAKQIGRELHEQALLSVPGLSNSGYMFGVAARIRRYVGHIVQLKYWLESSPNLMDDAMQASRSDVGQALQDLIHIATLTAALLPTYLTGQPERPEDTPAEQPF